MRARCGAAGAYESTKSRDSEEEASFTLVQPSERVKFLDTRPIVTFSPTPVALDDRCIQVDFGYGQAEQSVPIDTLAARRRSPGKRYGALDHGLLAAFEVRPAGAQPLNLGVSMASQTFAVLTSDPSARSVPFLRSRPGTPVSRLSRISEYDLVSDGTVWPVRSANGLAAKKAR